MYSDTFFFQVALLPGCSAAQSPEDHKLHGLSGALLLPVCRKVLIKLGCLSQPQRRQTLPVARQVADTNWFHVTPHPGRWHLKRSGASCSPR